MTVKSKESSAPPDPDVAEHRQWIADLRVRAKRADSHEIQICIYECLVDILEALKK